MPEAHNGSLAPALQLLQFGTLLRRDAAALVSALPPRPQPLAHEVAALGSRTAAVGAPGCGDCRRRFYQPCHLAACWVAFYAASLSVDWRPAVIRRPAGKDGRRPFPSRGGGQPRGSYNSEYGTEERNEVRGRGREVDGHACFCGNWTILSAALLKFIPLSRLNYCRIPHVRTHTNRPSLSWDLQRP